jgi:hypothetical protein
MRLIPIEERNNGHSQRSPSGDQASRIEMASRRAETASTSGGKKARAGSAARPWGIARVPTHTVGRASERRAYVRASLALPLSVCSVAGRREASLAALKTQDISSSGIFFLCPRRIEPGTPIEMEVTLVDKPAGRGTVRMRTQACVVRVESVATPGWHGLAAAFDDITFIRDESVPSA